MPRNINKIEMHDFYCCTCGNYVISLPRQISHKHKTFHKKWLWCPSCKTEHNTVECKSFNEMEQFKEDFKNGKYKDADQEFVDNVRPSWQW